MNKLIYIFLLLTIVSCHTEQTIPVEIDVAIHIKNDNHTSPVYVTIENNTKSASNYLWTFEGGEPATSTKKEPGVVTFTTPGEHTITLEAWNDGDRMLKTYTIRVDSAVTANFKVEADINNYAPAIYRITNLSSGGDTYKWTFEGGEPAVYDGQNPPAVTYPQAGYYTIYLTIHNGSTEFTTSQEIEVRESMDASFSVIPSFEDEDDMEAPLRGTFDVQLQGVESLRWECTGAVIKNPNSVDASIYFASAGTYTVYLNVSNGKESKRVAQTIIVKANTNLRTHKDICLGINTAQQTIGSFYSTKLRRSFRASEINLGNGSMIDIAYFGLNPNFAYNRFVSPDKLNETPLYQIPNASFTQFINKMELGNLTLSATQFENMTTDALLRDLPIMASGHNNEAFSNLPLPRVVLFETADGRKGAILVKKMITNQIDNSYIIVDIKVQKND